jgi:hypothetical protein
MRIALVLAALSVASPALAQAFPPITPQDAGALVQQEITRQQLVQQQNQLTAMEAQLRLQQNQLEIERLKVVPRLTPPDVSHPEALPQIDTSQLASIPDSALADSNKKVLQAAGNHH